MDERARVILEDIQRSQRLLAEGLQATNQKLDTFRVETVRRFDELENRIIAVDVKLTKRLDDVTVRLDDVTVRLDDVTVRLDDVTVRLDDVTVRLERIEEHLELSGGDVTAPKPRTRAKSDKPMPDKPGKTMAKPRKRRRS